MPSHAFRVVPVILALVLVGGACAQPAPPTSTPAAPPAATATAAPARAATTPTAAPTAAPTAKPVEASRPTSAPAAATSAATPTAAARAGATAIRWLGHAAFLLTSSAGTRILVDPFDANVGYALPRLDGVDAVVIGHEHSDHNNVGMATGQPTIIRGLDRGDWAQVHRQVKDVRVRSVATYHDAAEGKQRGKNAAFVFEVDGLRLVHLSDLGHRLSPEQVRQLAPVDVLMIPVGGTYTIDAAGATQVVEQLAPRLVLPMHYRTPATRSSLPIAGVEPFLEGKRVERPEATTLTVDRASLPATTTVVVLKYE